MFIFVGTILDSQCIIRDYLESIDPVFVSPINTSRNCIQELSNCQMQLDPDPQMNSRSARIFITCSSILAKGCRRERDREGHKKERNLKIPWISLIWLWKWLKNHAVKYHFIERINDLFIPYFNIKKNKGW